MNNSIERARQSFDRFLAELYPGNEENSMIKFHYRNADGEIENLWGDLISAEGETYSVFVRTPPLQPHSDFERSMTIAERDIIDWSVMYEDGTLDGNYTNRALFKIFEREEGYLHPQFVAYLARFRKEVHEA